MMTSFEIKNLIMSEDNIYIVLWVVYSYRCN